MALRWKVPDRGKSKDRNLRQVLVSGLAWKRPGSCYSILTLIKKKTWTTEKINSSTVRLCGRSEVTGQTAMSKWVFDPQHQKLTGECRD